jgi:hypothetical protein
MPYKFLYLLSGVSLLFTKFTNTLQNEVLHAQCRTENAILSFCKLTGRCKTEHFLSYDRLTTADNGSDNGQTRPLVREGAPQGQDRNCQTIINIWS